MYCHFGCNLIHILIIFPESLSINQRKKWREFLLSTYIFIFTYYIFRYFLLTPPFLFIYIYHDFSSFQAFIFFNVITSLFLFILLPSSIFLFVFINKSSFSLLIQTSFRWIIPDFEKNSLLSYFFGIYQIVFLIIFNFILSFLSNDSLKQFYIQSQLILHTYSSNVN